MHFCCSLQQELLLLPWPESMLRWASCAPQYAAAGTALLWQGLRMQCGVSWGIPLQRKPLATGMPACTLAVCAAAAAAAQCLVEKTNC